MTQILTEAGKDYSHYVLKSADHENREFCTEDVPSCRNAGNRHYTLILIMVLELELELFLTTIR